MFERLLMNNATKRDGKQVLFCLAPKVFTLYVRSVIF